MKTKTSDSKARLPTGAGRLLIALAVPLISPNALAAGPEWFQVATNSATAPPSRAFHGMVYDSVRRVALLHGGVGGPPSSAVMADTWSWDGKDWTRLTRQGPMVWAYAWAFDAGRGVAVLHGGWRDTGPAFFTLSATWEWDGQTWRKVSDGVGPGKRGSSAMAYDPIRKGVVLHGGTLDIDGNAILSDTWFWDGASWSEIPNAGGPKRTTHSMVYDERRQVMVLFGGIDARGSGPVDTWEFDGTQWQRVATNGPPGGREFPILGYDAFRGVTILTSGGEWLIDGFPDWKYFDDVWEWNGSQWIEVTPPGLRPQHVQGAMGAYDQRRARLVQFGGTTDPDTHVVSNTSWEYGLPELRLTGINRQPNGNLVIAWTGGAPSYQLQSRSHLTEGDWQDLGAPTDQTSVTVPPEDDASFFRVLRVSTP